MRAPLAHIADQVFIDLSREIEAQGVGRKVVADMFGLALRTYQKKVRRLTESVTVRDQTLWEAVLGFIADKERVSRRQVIERFIADGEVEVGAVLSDLVGEGLIYCTGRGDGAIYGKTSTLDQRAISSEQGLDAVAHFMWVQIYRQGPISRDELYRQITEEPRVADEALARLEADGRVTVIDQESVPMLQASNFLVPVGSEQGWEAAVFDHFSTMSAAIASKVRRGRPKSQDEDVVGGATLSFDIHPDHPFQAEVRGLLRRVRADVNDLWQKVAAHNRQHPPPEETKVRVFFYFGQNVEDGGERPAGGKDA